MHHVFILTFYLLLINLKYIAFDTISSELCNNVNINNQILCLLRVAPELVNFSRALVLHACMGSES